MRHLTLLLCLLMMACKGPDAAPEKGATPQPASPVAPKTANVPPKTPAKAPLAEKKIPAMPIKTPPTNPKPPGLLMEGVILVGGPKSAYIVRRADKPPSRVYAVRGVNREPLAIITLRDWAPGTPKLPVGVDPFQPKVSSRNVTLTPASAADWLGGDAPASLRKTQVANAYYVADIVLKDDPAAQWILDGWRFMPFARVSCEAPAQCPLRVCNCGGGNLVQGDHHPCTAGRCSEEGLESCAALCDSADFGEGR